MPKKILLTLILVTFLTACAPAAPTVDSHPTIESTPAPSPAPETAARDWWREAVFYEIFVRSFYDSDGNGVGDFNGIVQKLDYIESLGVNALWLMPIQPSPSYHGYDVTNYYNVNHDYGSMDDFRSLVEEAHKRDIKIIIDLVINHTSDRHPFFRNALSDVNSPYRDWYIWSGESQGNNWRQAGSMYYYALFCGCMPDLNYNNPEVSQEIYKITDFWLSDVGIDGFRVDAAKHLIEEGGKIENTPATHEWYRNFYPIYKAQNPQAYTVGEVFGAGSSIIRSYTGDQLDQVFNFEMSSGFVNSANGGANSGIVSAYKFAAQDMPDHNYATFLTNHDQTRAMSVFYGNVEKAKLASFLMLTAPGTPFIYYGEEIGMQGQKPDPDLRVPMQWSGEENAGFTTGAPWHIPNADYSQVNVAAQINDPNSLLLHYQTLIKLRKSHSALKLGDAVLLDTGNPAVLGLLRTSADEKLLILVNLSASTVQDYELTLDESALTGTAFTPVSIFGDAQNPQTLTVTNGKFQGYLPLAELPPYQGFIFELR